MPTCSKLEDVGFGAVGSSFPRSDSAIIYSDGDPFEECAMQFRLLYSGRLLGASRNDTRASLKHEIRCEISPQLKRLWESQPNLRKACFFQSAGWTQKHPEDDQRVRSLATGEEVNAARVAYGLRYMGEKWNRCKQDFIPLVTAEMGLRCKIDILFLRPEEPGMIVKGADLDNRLKTLFDALRLPRDCDEMPNHKTTSDPVYCLLEDDRLISEIRVIADHLLLLPKEREITPNDVFLVLDVSLESPSSGSWHNAFN
jgi:hypothetical protein